MHLFRGIILAFALLTSNIANANILTTNRPTYSNVITTANQYVGLHERSNRAALKSVTKVDPARTPWCAAFVNGVLQAAGFRGTGSNTARSFTKYKRGTTNPQQGDIVVIRRKGGSGAHVGLFKGFVSRNGKKMVAVLGGNQSNKVSVAYYSPSKVISYRRVS